MAQNQSQSNKSAELIYFLMTNSSVHSFARGSQHRNAQYVFEVLEMLTPFTEITDTVTCHAQYISLKTGLWDLN